MKNIDSVISLIVPASLAGLLALYGLRRLLDEQAKRWRGAKGEREVQRTLKRLFSKSAHNLYLPLPGSGRLTEIDHIVLTSAGLLVVETKNYSGDIYGRADESTWTKFNRGKSRTFQNPLKQNQAHIRAVQALNLGVPVIGRVVLAGPARFPKGVPDGVSYLKSLRHDLKELRRGRPSPALEAAWSTLLANARTDRAAQKAHREGLRARYGYER